MSAESTKNHVITKRKIGSPPAAIARTTRRFSVSCIALRIVMGSTVEERYVRVTSRAPVVPRRDRGCGEFTALLWKGDRLIEDSKSYRP